MADDLVLIPRAHGVEGERRLPHVVLRPHKCAMMHMCVHTDTHRRINVIYNFFKCLDFIPSLPLAHFCVLVPQFLILEDISGVEYMHSPNLQ